MAIKIKAIIIKQKWSPATIKKRGATEKPYE